MIAGAMTGEEEHLISATGQAMTIDAERSRRKHDQTQSRGTISAETRSRGPEDFVCRTVGIVGAGVDISARGLVKLG